MLGHAVRLFVGPLVALRAFEKISRHARIFALTPEATVFVVPFDEDLEDDVQQFQGTGDCLDAGPRISTGVMAFAARASQGAGISYLETEYFGGVGEQNAVLWQNGVLTLGPLTMSSDGGALGRRPRTLWPINAVLRGLGLRAEVGLDEFDAIGLGAYRSLDAIVERAQQVDRQV
jgi:hypothetical protein